MSGTAVEIEIVRSNGTIQLVTGHTVIDALARARRTMKSGDKIAAARITTDPHRWSAKDKP